MKYFVVDDGWQKESVGDWKVDESKFIVVLKRFSDIDVNMHYLISPRQSQVWYVLKDSFHENHMRYVIDSGFLRRLCWSVYIDKLSKRQFDMMLDVEKFYEKVCYIIKKSKIWIFRLLQTDIFKQINKRSRIKQ